MDEGFVYCIIYRNIDKSEYKSVLYSVCWRLHMLARLVYKGKDGISKLPIKTYREILFKYYTESSEEMTHIVKKIGIAAMYDMVKYVFKCLRSMETQVNTTIDA